MDIYREDSFRNSIDFDARRAARMRARQARRLRRRIKWFLTKILPFCLVVCALLTGVFFGIRGVVLHVQNQLGKGTVEDVDNEILMAEMDVTDTAESAVLEDSLADGITEDEIAAGATEGLSDGNPFTEETVINESPIIEEAQPSEETEVAMASEAGGIDFAIGNYYADKAGSVSTFDDTILSTNAILVDVSDHAVIANRKGYERISPASMTKVLTLLVAAEHLEGLDGTFTINEDITYYVYKHGLSVVGFGNNEVVTIKDLLYGTILPSGADAALGLACYIAGSEEAFVTLMNEKLDELGLSGTSHMTNCSGVFDEDHYSTCHDIAVIMMAAMDNELCKSVLSEHKYTTSSTDIHPAGIEVSNWFLRRIEDKDSGGLVVGAKTGYVKESGHCAVSYATDSAGKPYICVTVNAGSNWKCIYDHVRIYKQKFM